MNFPIIQTNLSVAMFTWNSFTSGFIDNISIKKQA